MIKEGRDGLYLTDGSVNIKINEEDLLADEITLESAIEMFSKRTNN